MNDRRSPPGAKYLKASWQVLVHFQRNRGLLLAGAIAYYALLSIIPLLVLLLVGLSHLVDEAELMATLRHNVGLVVPGHAHDVMVAIEQVIEQRNVVTGAGVLVLLVFSSFAFSVLENAMEVIFHHRRERHRRHFVVSLILPYVCMCFLSAGILLFTVLSGAIGLVDGAVIHAAGSDWSLGGFSSVLLYILGIAGLTIVFTAMYMVFPVGKIRFTHALAGGATAAVLWEITRHVLVWYYASVSMVQVVYGTFATAVVSLLTFEVGAIIILLGAQVIADVDRRGNDDLES